jgi:hypothetical protein
VIVELTNWVTNLLGPPEEPETSSCVPSYLQRWVIFENQLFKVYLHHSFSEDLAVDLCNYPERLISLGVVSSYVEDPLEHVEAFSDREVWMVLIAKSSDGRQRGSSH